MSKDNQSGTSAKNRYNLRDRKSMKKKNESSDSSDNSDYSESESEIDMNNDEYQKFLSKIFPSKICQIKLLLRKKWNKWNESINLGKKRTVKKAKIRKKVF